MYESFPNTYTHLLAIYSITKLPTTVNQLSPHQPIAVININMILYTYTYKHAINLYANICIDEIRYQGATVMRAFGPAVILLLLPQYTETDRIRYLSNNYNRSRVFMYIYIYYMYSVRQISGFVVVVSASPPPTARRENYRWAAPLHLSTI